MTGLVPASPGVMVAVLSLPPVPFESGVCGRA